jgi:uncharacterized membrane protein
MRGRVLESERVWLWTIVIVGCFLRLYRLDYQSLWADEGLQYFVANNNSLGEILSQVRSFHPPLSFVINKAFLRIGESEFFLRLPSALFGIATLPIFYHLTRELTSGRVALVSTFVLAVSPFHIWYSQEGRMYAELVFFSVLSSVVLLQALKHRETRWWIAYVLVSAAGVYTQIFMILALLAQFGWVLFYHRKSLILHVASGVAVFTLFVPWVLLLPWVQRFFQRVSEHGLGAGPPVGSRAAFRAGFSLENIPYTFFAYSSGFSVGPTVAELHENRNLGFILQFAPEILSVAVVFGALLLVGLTGLYKMFGARTTVFCLLGLCLPVLGALVYALAPRATYNVRYSIVAFPFFCILLGTGLTVVLQKYRLAGVAFLLGIVAISSTSIANHFFNPRYAKEDVRSAVAFWRSNSRAGPLLSYKSHHVLSVYLTDSEKPRHSRLSGDVVSDINLAFSKGATPFVYVVLARDWRKLKEMSIRDAFPIDLEKSYPGVRILKISNSRKAHDPAGAL